MIAYNKSLIYLQFPLAMYEAALIPIQLLPYWFDILHITNCFNLGQCPLWRCLTPIEQIAFSSSLKASYKGAGSKDEAKSLWSGTCIPSNRYGYHPAWASWGFTTDISRVAQQIGNLEHMNLDNREETKSDGCDVGVSLSTEILQIVLI